METETINKLFLELSQFTEAKTKREIELEECLRSILSDATAENDLTIRKWPIRAANYRTANNLLGIKNQEDLNP